MPQAEKERESTNHARLRAGVCRRLAGGDREWGTADGRKMGHTATANCSACTLWLSGSPGNSRFTPRYALPEAPVVKGDAAARSAIHRITTLVVRLFLLFAGFRGQLYDA